jgi:Fe-S-cluster containining protein
MNFPAIAKQTYEKLRSQPAFSNITQFVIDHLKKISSPLERARFVHHVVDDYNSVIFAHPIVQKFLPCKVGCSGCCHTQVGITEDEAELLASRVNEGLKIDYALLQNQIKVGNSPEDFYQLSYENRRCIFLGTDDSCQAYNDRPSVCRTNAVLGEASQCSPHVGDGEPETIRLLKTEQADMAIMGSFFMSKESGTLPNMLGRILLKNKPNIFPKNFEPRKKSVFNDIDL